uniref:Uncharacterized protein n=1 Tax=Knipowitschia caucasica TaxID=637954 RepID=A0AAV2JDW0_KNICA
MKNLSSSAAKCGPADGEPPPDLLQQLLQYTTQRMRNVSHSSSRSVDVFQGVFALSHVGRSRTSPYKRSPDSRLDQKNAVRQKVKSTPASSVSVRFLRRDLWQRAYDIFTRVDVVGSLRLSCVVNDEVVRSPAVLSGPCLPSAALCGSRSRFLITERVQHLSFSWRTRSHGEHTNKPEQRYQ